MEPNLKAYIIRQVRFCLRYRKCIPHNFGAGPGCKTCGQGPGAIQHNSELLRNYEELKPEITTEFHDPLELKFEETGGYDCMTGAWIIYGPGKKDSSDYRPTRLRPKEL